MSDLLCLEVWRPAIINKNLIYTCNEDSKDTPEAIFNMDRLHEQIYSWKVKGDIWTSLAGTERAQSIREKVTTMFLPDIPVDKRSFSIIFDLISEIESYLEDDKNREWQSWGQSLSEYEEEGSCWMQPLLSFHLQLKWIYDVFKDIPGASVTIR